MKATPAAARDAAREARKDDRVYPVFESVEAFSPDQFEAWVEERELLGDTFHYELLNGRIVMTPPAGWPHGRVEIRLAYRLESFVLSTGRGAAFGSSQGFALPTGDVVEPDLSFVSQERWEAAETPVDGKFLRVVPDLIIEILSPSNASRDRGEKLLIYARAGVREYWIVDPNLRRVSQWSRGKAGLDGPVVVADEDASVASTAAPGLSVPLAAIFR